jgi:hypothetical protein
MDGDQVLQEAMDAYRVALGDRLLAAYALGSLAHGGFSRLVSDIDLALIVSDPARSTDSATIHAVAEAERAKGSELHTRLSVFWGTPSTLSGVQSGGRFPALDRLDLIESGRLIAGSDDARRGLPRPSTRELIVTGAEFALDHLAGVRPPTATTGELGSMRLAQDDAVQEILVPELLVDHGIRRVTKLVLFPVRFLYTAATGRVGTNDAAVAHHLADHDPPAAELVAAALRWRGSAPDNAEAIDLLRRQIVPLYTAYIDDYVSRLVALDRGDLAEAFREWRRRLEP